MSVLQELIKAGEQKLAREEWQQKRVEAQAAERVRRTKEIILGQMYPQIAEYIDYEKMVDKGQYLTMPVNPPGCVPFTLYVFRNFQNALLRKDPNGEEVAFFSSMYDIQTNDLEIALAQAHNAWLVENSPDPVYADPEESA